MTKRRNYITRRSFITGCLVPAAFTAFAGLSGCRDSDALFNDYYVDWSSDYDYDNPQKSFINTPDRTPTSSLPQVYKTNSDAVEEEVELPEYDEQQEDDTKADQNITDANSQNTGESTSGGGAGTEDGEGGGNGGEGDDGDDSDDDVDIVNEKPASVGGNTDVGNNASKNSNFKPDSEGCVIAFGEMANIALMLGGDGALWACDNTFHKAIGTVYKDGSSMAKNIRDGYWGGYSKTSTTMKTSTFKKLYKAIEACEEAKRPVYVVYDGSIGSLLTKKQAAKLESDFGIKTVYFYLTTVALMKNATNAIAKILSTTCANDAPARHKEYWEYHDARLEDARSQNDGKVGAWSTGAEKANLNFQDGKSTWAASKCIDESELKWTLVIDDWDEGVSYSHNGVKAEYGLGISHIGSTWSPVSCYLQNGGVVNNAAAYLQASNTSSKSTRRYVWQFDVTTFYPPVGKNLSHASLTNTTTETIQKNTDNADVLMRVQCGDFGLGKLGGEQRFPAVIVRDETAQKLLQKDCASSSGVYAAHYLKAGATHNNSSYAAAGVKYTGGGGALWQSFVGYVGSGVEIDNAYKSTSEPYDIYVNPHGVYSSWLDGSVESFLEAAWAVSRFYKGGDMSYAQSEVEAFYEKFYGQAPSSSNVSKILKGSFA